MTNLSQRIPTRGPQYQQNDNKENRQRVATYVDGNTLAYEGTLTSAGSPVTIDFGTDSGGKTAHFGYLINDGTGDFTVAFSNDGVNYGSQHTIRTNERMDVGQLSIKKMQLTWISDDAAYRVLLA